MGYAGVENEIAPRPMPDEITVDIDEEIARRFEPVPFDNGAKIAPANRRPLSGDSPANTLGVICDEKNGSAHPISQLPG
jgi:hypothetical protein